jgi:hypothetical protein
VQGAYSFFWSAFGSPLTIWFRVPRNGLCSHTYIHFPSGSPIYVPEPNYRLPSPDPHNFHDEVISSFWTCRRKLGKAAYGVTLAMLIWCLTSSLINFVVFVLWHLIRVKQYTSYWNATLKAQNK